MVWKFPVRVLVVFSLLCGVAAPSHAGGLKGLGNALDGLNPFKKNDEALTTSIKDATGEVPYLDDFAPLNSGNIFALPRNESGDFLIRPGAYSGTFQSFCLHAGTYGPTSGAGYVTAPLKGPKAKLISRFLAGAGRHPEIPQHDVQSLIWAVEARSSLSQSMTSTAIRLLAGRNGFPDPKDLLELNGGVMSLLPMNKLGGLLNKANAAMRPILQARNLIRQLTAAGGSFEEMARVAVLDGEPPASQQVRTIPGNRWVYAPSGVFVRYAPSGYQQTSIQVFCPEPFFVRSDQAGRIREIETKDHGYKLETVYDEDAANGGANQHSISALVLSHGKKTMLRLTLRGVSVATGAPTATNAAQLQEMQQQFIGNKPRTLTPLAVNLTNYRDSVSQALVKLPDEDARNLLNDFISRA
jgi:hypothetical protein